MYYNRAPLNLLGKQQFGGQKNNKKQSQLLKGNTSKSDFVNLYFDMSVQKRTLVIHECVATGKNNNNNNKKPDIPLLKDTPAEYTNQVVPIERNVKGHLKKKKKTDLIGQKKSIVTIFV